MAGHNIFVGTETGYLKGVSLNNGLWNNLNSVVNLDKSQEVTCLCWGNQEQSEICLGRASQEVYIYNENFESEVINLPKRDDDILIGISKFNENLLTCTKLGLLQLWSEDKNKFTKSVGPNVNVMKQDSTKPHMVATGGKENELKVWDMHGQEEPSNYFTAKNVKNDWLDLRVPVYICDIAFVPETNQIFTSTGLHQLRLYDTKSQRRPVAEMLFEDSPINTISIANSNNQVVVGNARGAMGLLDLRGKGYLVHKFKGSSGAIKQVLCNPQQNIVASCGLDRFLRIYHIQSNLLLHKTYLKAKLTCMLMKDDVSAMNIIHKDKEYIQTNQEIKDIADSDIWTNMEVVKTEKVPKKTKEQIASDMREDRVKHLKNQLNISRKRKSSE